MTDEDHTYAVRDALEALNKAAAAAVRHGLSVELKVRGGYVTAMNDQVPPRVGGIVARKWRVDA